jgi:hypothetical protein
MKWVFLLLPAGLMAQTPAEQRGKKIVDQAVEALGGNAFLTMEDRTESGRAYSYYHDQISGLSIAKIYTRYITVAPNKTGELQGQREHQVFGKNEDSGVLFTEDGGWEITWRGAKELPKDRVDRYRESLLRNIFYLFRQRLHEPGMIFEFRGSDVWENLPVDIVDITDSEDRLITVYFHQSTHLPARQLYRRKNAETKEQDQEVTLFARYQETAGVQWPHQIRRERNGEKVYEIFAESVKINKDLTDDLFSLPAPGAKQPEKTRKK